MLWGPALPDCPSSVLLHSVKCGKFNRMASVRTEISSLGPGTPDKKFLPTFWPSQKGQWTEGTFGIRRGRGLGSKLFHSASEEVLS